ncbi:MAG: hypothetical protein J6V24_05845, partial [Clostridia bacterium]|nr:hypothetical protein [Clostridia bacterium]
MRRLFLRFFEQGALNSYILTDNPVLSQDIPVRSVQEKRLVKKMVFCYNNIMIEKFVSLIFSPERSPSCSRYSRTDM